MQIPSRTEIICKLLLNLTGFRFLHNNKQNLIGFLKAGKLGLCEQL